MTTDPNGPTRPKRFQPRQGERRQVNALRGVPLIGGLGLVFNERRSQRDRRRGRRNAPPPCALLQHREKSRSAPGLLHSVYTSAIGAWIKRRLKNPWGR